MKKLYTLLALGVCLLSFQTSQAFTWNVGVQSFAFVNSPSVVNLGDTIRWTLLDASTHTTTSSSVPAGAASWDHVLDQFNASNYYVVTVAGSYSYYCVYHSMMTATFTAQPATAVPTPTLNNATVFVTADANNVNVVYTVGQNANTRLTLTDLSGRTLSVTECGMQTAGTYNTSFAAAALPKGIYLVSVQAGEATLSRKVCMN